MIILQRLMQPFMIILLLSFFSSLSKSGMAQDINLLDNMQLAHKQTTPLKISLENLSIYNLLLAMQKNIESVLSNLLEAQNSISSNQESSERLQQPQAIQALQALYAFTNETIALFEYIVHTILNQGELAYNPEIEYKFVNTYSCLDITGAIKPRHLRRLKQKIEDLNNYIKSYCAKRKKFLGQQDIANFNAIAQLNFRLLDWILKDEFIGIDYWDRLIDTCLYQPWEWVCGHKRFVIVAAALIAFASWYYFAPFYNFNHDYDILQHAALSQSGDECSYNALYNISCLLSGATIDDRRQLLQNSQDLNAFLGRFSNRQALDEEDLSRIADQYLTPNVKNRLIILPASDILRAPHPTERLDEIYENSNITGKIWEFEQGRPLGFVINIGSWENQDGSLSDVSGRISHWICASFTRNATAKNGISIEVADSIGRNRTNHTVINDIVNKILLPNISTP